MSSNVEVKIRSNGWSTKGMFFIKERKFKNKKVNKNKMKSTLYNKIGMSDSY
jgi:hypothetical protein